MNINQSERHLRMINIWQKYRDAFSQRIVPKSSAESEAICQRAEKRRYCLR